MKKNHTSEPSTHTALNDLFDTEWYLEQYPEVLSAGIDPRIHYLEHGAAEGRDPHPLFDTKWYLSNNQDVVKAGINPFVHYLIRGSNQGRDPHPLFNNAWYQSEHPEVLRDGVNPLIHFVSTGIFREFDCNPRFRQDWSSFPASHDAPKANVISEPRHRGEPKVSIIVPVFNKLPYLKECLDSLIAQSLSPIEIVCVDDCSTDGSTALLLEYAARNQNICVLQMSINAGPAMARNMGIQYSKGNFVQFTDADDIVPQAAIEALWQIAVSDGVDLVRGGLGFFESALGLASFGREPPQLSRRRVFFGDEPSFSIPWHHPCFLFSRRMLIDGKILYPNLRDGEDPVFVAEALAKSKHVSTVEEITYLHRRGSGYNRQSLVFINDFIRQVAIVKRIFLATVPKFWHEGYRPHLARCYNDCFLRRYRASVFGRRFISLIMKRAGLHNDFECDAGGPG